MRSTSRSGRPASWCRPGYRIALTVRGKDYVYGGGASAGLKTLGTAWTGVGPFQHNDPRDRPASVFGGNVTLHAGPGRNAYLLLPVIPGEEEVRQA